MKKLKRFTVSRNDQADWTYVVEFEDDSGSVIHMSADFEALDEMATAVIEQMDAVVEAAAQLPPSR
jgi:hypothetical protein